MMTSNLKRNTNAFGWFFLILLFLVPSVATADVAFSISAVSDTTPLEGSVDHTISFDVTMSGDALSPGETAEFSYAFTAGTPAATLGDDYAPDSLTTMQIYGPQSTPYVIPVSIMIHGDSVIEQDEVFQIALTDATGPGTVTFDAASHAVTITNDDEAVIGIVVDGSGTVAEGGTAYFNLTNVSGVTLDTTYTINLDWSGSSVDGSDLSASLPTSVTVGPGTTFPLDIDIATIDDTLIEGTELLTVTLEDPESPASDQVSIDGTAAAWDVTSADEAVIGIVVDGSGTVAEGGTAYFNLTNVSGVTLDTTYTINLDWSGSSVDGSDLSASLPTSVTVGPGTTFPLDIDIATIDDTLIEGTELLTVTLEDPESPASDQVSIDGTAAAWDVTSADEAVIGIVVDGSGTVAEGGTAYFNLTNVSGVTLDTTYTINLDWSGSSVDGSDLSASLPTSVTVGPGTTFPLDIDIATIDDTLIEGTELLTVTLEDPESPASDQVSIDGTAAAWDVTSADEAVIGIVVDGSGTVAEGGTAYFNLTNVSGVTLDTTYTINLDWSGTADATDDLDTTLPTTISIGPGTTFPVDVDIVTKDDTLWEQDETLTVVLTDPESPASDQVSVDTTTASWTIDNTDDISFTLTAPSSAVDEETDTVATFTVTRGGTATGLGDGYSITIDYETLGITAVDGEDFNGVTNGEVTFAGNDAVVEFTVGIIDDDYVEPDQIFQAFLTDPSLDLVSVVGDSSSPVDCTIASGDTTIARITAAPASVNEAAVTGNYTVELDNPVEGAGAVTISWQAIDASADVSEDLVAFTGTANTTDDPATSASFTIATAEDVYVEGPEEFYVELTGVSAFDSSVDSDIAYATDSAGPTTIYDSDESDITISSSTSSVPEMGDDYLANHAGDVPPPTMDIVFTVVADDLVPGDAVVEVNYRTVQLTGSDAADGGDDYVEVNSGVITFGPGSDPPSKTVSIQVLNDDLIEDAERFEVHFSPGLRAGTLNTEVFPITIFDNDILISPSYNNGGSIEIEGSGAGNDYIADYESNIRIDVAWQHGLESFTGYTGDAPDASIIVDPGAAGLNQDSPGHITNYQMTVTGVAPGATITPTASFRHGINFDIDTHGAADISGGVSATNVTGAGILIVNDLDDVKFQFRDGDATDADVYCVGSVSTDVEPPHARTYQDFDDVTDDHSLNVVFRNNQITVNIDPIEVGDPGIVPVNARGQWQLLNDADPPVPVVNPGGPADGWYNSGDSVSTQCNVSDYTINFKDVAGWIKPDPISLTIGESSTGPLTFSGTYQIRSYLLQVDQVHLDGGGEGTITITPLGESGPNPGEYYYYTGESVEVAAVPPDGSIFSGWTGAVTSYNPYVTIVMDDDKELTARFALPSDDVDRDGYDSTLDCNDNDPSIHPDAPEYCDGVDSNCNGMDDEPCTGDDEDQDGDGYSTNQGDCNDDPADPLAPTIYPGATDTPGDGIDQDCYDGDREVQATEITCVVPDETPLETQIKAAPPLVMFLIDDSGSMDFEFMTDEDGGGFEGDNYLYPDAWSDSDERYPSGWYMDESQRRKWLSQWVGVNRIYFDPEVEYTPWPRWNTLPGTYGSPGFNAHPDNPRMNPVNDRTLSMRTTFFSVNAIMGVPDQSITVRKIDPDPDRKVAADAVAVCNSSTCYFVDNRNETGARGFYEEPAAGWSTYVDAETYGGDCRTNYANGSEATWYLKIPSGTYDVYAFNPNAGADMAHAVDYIIEHDGSTAHYDDFPGVPDGTYWDQTNSSYQNRWKKIGEDLYFHSTDYTEVNIPVAHYFTIDDANGNGVRDAGENIYLVVVDDEHVNNVGGFTYYRFEDGSMGYSPNERVDDGELALVPAGSSELDNIRPTGTYAEVRQNFANWYSFYRRRELTAKAAISQVVEEIDKAKVGMAVLNNRSDYNHPVVSIDLDGVDQTAQFLDWLYEIDSYSGTPLRRGLQDVGQYFDQNATYDGGNDGEISSTSPWSDGATGGGCQRAFVIAMTDGYYNEDWDDIEWPLRGSNDDADGSTRTGADSIYDGGVFLGPNPNSYQTTLADIAMYYYENDLVPTLTNVVPSYNYDLAPHQHMVTYGVAFGVNGELVPSDYDDCLPKCDPNDINKPCPEPTCPTWEAPVIGDRSVIDDLYHATVNGRGGFYSAGNPEQLKRALIAIFNEFDEMNASGSSVAVNAQELQGDSALYQAIYVSGDWTGDVKAKPLDPDTGLVEQIENADGEMEDFVQWSAADQIDGATWSDREIITFNDDSQAGVVFAYDEISSAQQALLDSDPDIAAAMVRYLRGETSQEESKGGIFRDRVSLLGDIVHASPMPYRWDPEQPGVIFVGANDGMLHALDELTGDEVFGYIPNLVFANLKELTIDPYDHKYFVDNEPYIAKPGGSATILVGGLGRGGRGYYCLNISDIGDASFNATDSPESIVKWEYPVNSDPENAAIDPDMGYSYSHAYIVESAAGWVVIFGNGYGSQNGEAVLYAIRINSDGSFANPLDPVKKIYTDKGGADPNCNGLSTPALVDVDLDGLVDFAYAGDLLGNMWKFDLRDSNVNNWEPAYNSEGDKSGTWEPIFQAKNASGFRQPITTRPEVMRHCIRGQDGYIVLFGTGRFIGIEDFADSAAVQTIYGIWDWGDAWENLNSSYYSDEKRNPIDKYLGAFDTDRQLSNLVDNAAIPETDQTIYLVDLTSVAIGNTVKIGSTTFTAANLTDEDELEFYNAAGLQEVIEATLTDVSVEATAHQVILRSNPPGDDLSVTVSGGITRQEIDMKVSLLNQGIIYHQGDFIVLSNNSVDWFNPRNGSGQHVGWYFDLPGYSERLVNDVILRGGVLYTIPTIPSDSPCEAGGSSIIYALNACNGGRTSNAVFDIDGDFRVNSADLINIGTAENPIWVAPTGLRRGELLFTPSILAIPGTGTDILHFSKSGGNLETEIAITEKLGFLYWRTW